ncbi:hypothetical protein N7504_009483 [Penicillium tannophilum]|nr:hypothetical protein N7504_009483 [Penicillium tannophilum]
MLLNAETAISTSKVLFVPYSTWHVPRYHEWMQDEEIQEATASEPLTLEEEYSMQRSWRQDADKLTFITCRPVTQPATNSTQIKLRPEDESAANMIGDINLFLRIEDGEEGDAPPQIVGEIELMVAEKNESATGIRQGFGFGIHEVEILDEFVQSLDEGEREKVVQAAGTEGLRLQCLSVKIGQENVRSLALFESLGFVKVSAEPNFFGEFELRNLNLAVSGFVEALRVAGIEGYVELDYQRKE